VVPSSSKKSKKIRSWGTSHSTMPTGRYVSPPGRKRHPI
jgi:hypothetical protein